MVLRIILGNTADRTVTAERIKLLAGGCQLIAIGTFVSSIVSPLFNAALDSTLKAHVTGGIGFGLLALGVYIEHRWIGLPRNG